MKFTLQIILSILCELRIYSAESTYSESVKTRRLTSSAFTSCVFCLKACPEYTSQSAKTEKKSHLIRGSKVEWITGETLYEQVWSLQAVEIAIGRGLAKMDYSRLAASKFS